MPSSAKPAAHLLLGVVGRGLFPLGFLNNFEFLHHRDFFGAAACCSAGIACGAAMVLAAAINPGYSKQLAHSGHTQKNPTVAPSALQSRPHKRETATSKRITLVREGRSVTNLCKEPMAAHMMAEFH